MRRRLLSALFCLAAGLPALAGKPDIVLVSLDTFRADRLAAYGGPAKLCPELNAAASRGATFTGCFAPTPLTLPSHATLLTGCYPARTGLHDNGFGTLAGGLPGLAGTLKASGYATRAIVSSSVLDDRYGLARGFDHYDDGTGPTMRRTAEEVTSRALDALKARRGPLFLWVHYFDTHEPYEAPERYAAEVTSSRYDVAAAYVSAEVGRLLKALGPDTVVAVVADHGEGLGDHAELTHGTLLFQPTVSVPFFLFGPGIPAGGRPEIPCSLADVAPTLARFAGATLAPECDGVDLGPALAGKAMAVRAIPIETWFPYFQFRWHPLSSVTDGRYKWIRGRTLRLYDLQADPREEHDLAAKPPAAAVPLRGKLPPLPGSGPAVSQVDTSLRGLGYAPVPTSGSKLKDLPDPHDRTPLLAEMDRARVLRAEGEEAKALALFRKVATSDPGNPSAQFELGETLRRKGDLRGAAEALDRALALAPSMPEALTSRGMVLVAEQKEEQAAAYFEKALKSDPTMILALNPLAAYQLGRNRPAEAFPLLDRAIHEGFANADTYLIQLRVHLVQGKLDQAQRDFDEAMALSTDPPATLKAAADIFMIKEMVAQGVSLYEEGIRRFPGYAPNYLTLGTYFLQVDRPERALELYREALKLNLPPSDRQNVSEIVAELEAGLGPEAEEAPLPGP